MNALELCTCRAHAFKRAGGLVNGPFARASDETSRDVDGLARIGIKPRFGTIKPVDAVVVEHTLKSRSLELLAIDLKIRLRHPLAGCDVRWRRSVFRHRRGNSFVKIHDVIAGHL